MPRDISQSPTVPFKQHQRYFSPEAADSFKTQTLAHSSFKPSMCLILTRSHLGLRFPVTANEITLPV